MKIYFRPLFLVCALLLPFAAPAAAQVELTGINWEISKLQGKNRSPYAPVSSLRAAPEVKFTDYLRAIVTLRNPSAKAAEGLVLRYALSLRLLKAGDAPEKAFWSVPFYVEEVRVSKINPSSSRQARVIRFELQNQLNKLNSSGFSPTALKLEVMLAPRQGDSPSAIMREAIIEIIKP
jgi:hypothetical protein